MSAAALPSSEEILPSELVATIGPAGSAPGDRTATGPAFLHPGGFASALCDADGAILFADDRFARQGIPGLDARLDRLPPRGSARVSLLSGTDGSTMAVAVVAPEGTVDWPLADSVRQWLSRERAPFVAIACIPLAIAEAAGTEAARLSGLSGAEARVAAGLVRTGDLRGAAREAGLPYETARKVAKSAMRKAGVRRQGELVGLWVTLQTGQGVTQAALLPALIDLFGITPRQAAIAIAIADGGSRRDAAHALGVSEHAVKAELKAVFPACGVGTAAALSVLVNEIRILAGIVRATSIEPAGPARATNSLRLIPRIGRPGRIALIDHGPQGGLPVLILHTATTSRHNPPSFVHALQSHGIRPIALDRPGFGLSAMVEGDYLEQSAQDLADILDTLELASACILARGGTMVLARFAERWPERIRRAVVVNPEPPAEADRKRVGLTGAIKSLVYGQPWLTGSLANYLGRNASVGIVERLVLRSLESSAADRAVLSDPEVRAAYVHASQQSALQGAAGFRAVVATEPFEPARGIADGSMITIVCGSQDPLYNPADSLPRWQAAWPGCCVVIEPDAGRLVHFQKPDLIATLLAEGRG